MRIEATYRVTTPLFCGSAAPEEKPELRLPSFKGALRFWWRAVAWSRHGGDLKKIREQEARLFGSSDTGQSRLLMQWSDIPKWNVVAKDEILRSANSRVVGDGCRYLGYGVMEAFASQAKGTQAGQLTRPCIVAPLDFTIRMRARKLESAQVETLEHALIALGTLGGLGAKSRKGYGSLTLLSLRMNDEEKWTAPVSLKELKSALAILMPEGGRQDYPEYTALDGKSRHALLQCDSNNPLELLDRIGKEMIRFRSWGRKGKILGNRESEKNFRGDHDLMKKNPEDRTAHPKRIAFGLPHNYGSKKNQQVAPAKESLDRRASPLFIHIHQPADTPPVAVLSLLPARFLPEGRSKISVGGKSIDQKPEDELYAPVRDFLDRLLDSNRRKERFTHSEALP